jgi:hypothetical protein
MPSVGPYICIGSGLASGGDVNWTNPSNITDEDGLPATIVLGSGEASTGLIANQFNTYGLTDYQIDGIAVGIYKYASTVGSTDLISVGLYNGAGLSPLRSVTRFTGLETVGDETDLWNPYSTLTGSIVSDPDFGVVVYVADDASGCSLDIDYIQMTVWYSILWVPEQNSTRKLWVNTGARW